MMSSENIPPAAAAAAEMQTASTGSRKAAAQRGQPHEQQPVKCPRCDSSNTKFCYYNNYSLSQPRHFCKTCRRYWTKGGALRNVPIGGGCRKTKKLRPTAASRLLSSLNPPGTSEFGPGGLKFLGPAAAPAMEFQLGGLSLPRLHPATAGVYTQFVSGGPGCFGLDLMGLNYPAPNSSGSGHANTSSPSSVAQEHQISLSSIESLSSINQEMHWKLQQQRLALIYGNPTADDDQHQDHHHGDRHDHQNQKQKEKPAPPTAMNLFQNFEVLNNNNNNHHHSAVPKLNDVVATANNNGDHHQQIINCGDGGRKFEVGPTEWFFEQTPYTPSNNTSEIETSGAHLNGIQTASVSWGDLHQFHGLQ